MDSLDETNVRSFIVKVWVEDKAGIADQGVWHGHITDIPSHERLYLQNLAEIEDFIAPRLEAMGIKLGVRWRVKRWFKRMIKRSKLPA